MGAQDYYDLLDVDQDAHPDVIRRAYRRLALRCHPDKDPTQEAALRFAEISEAHMVLSDEQRRPIYDALGREGLRVYDMVGGIARVAPSLSEEAVLPPVILVHLGTAALGSLLLLAAAFALLVGWRLEGRILLPWPLIFGPLWLADPLLLLLAALAYADGRGTLRASAWRLAPSATLWLSFQMLLCARLQAPTAHSWLTVCTPLLVGRGVALSTLPARVLDARRSSTSATRRGLSRRHVTAIEGTCAVGAFVSAQLLLKCTQVALLPAQLEGSLRLPWHAALSPSWLAILLELGAVLIGCTHRPKASSRGAEPGKEQLHSLWLQASLIARLARGLACAALVGWLGGTLESLTSSDPATVRSQLMPPSTIALVLGFCCVCCVCSSARRSRSRANRRRRRCADPDGRPIDAPSPRASPRASPRSADCGSLGSPGSRRRASAQDQPATAACGSNAAASSAAAVHPQRAAADEMAFPESVLWAPIPEGGLPGAMPGAMPGSVGAAGRVEPLGGSCEP